MLKQLFAAISRQFASPRFGMFPINDIELDILWEVGTIHYGKLSSASNQRLQECLRTPASLRNYRSLCGALDYLEK